MTSSVFSYHVGLFAFGIAHGKAEIFQAALRQTISLHILCDVIAAGKRTSNGE